MKSCFSIAAVICLCLSANAAHAYGSTPSSHHCDKPIFSDFQPSVNKYLQSFSEFSFLASANTTPLSINVNLSLSGSKIHFGPKDLIITSHSNGRLEIKGKLDRPVEGGFARLSVTAHSTPGCEVTDGYLIRIH